MDFGSAFGGVLGGWLVTHLYHKVTQKDTHKQRIKDKMENIVESIQFAYKSKGEKRKTKLQVITYINIRPRRDLLGSVLVGKLEDILFKNMNNESETIVEVKQAFEKCYPKYFK